LSFDRPLLAIRRINEWAAKASGGMLPQLLKGGDLTGSTEMVLTDVVTFQGVWAQPFDSKETRTGTFHGQGRDVALPIMHQTGKFRCLLEREHNISGLSIVELPYQGDRLALDIFLPSPTRTVAEMEKELTVEQLEGYLGKLESVTLQVGVPRFRFRSRCELQRPLEQLGMTTIWAGAADFSGLFSKGGESRLSRFFQEVVIDVNERGSKAAAGTAAVVTRAMAASFEADRPFLFLIRDRETNLILFLGRFTG